MSNVSPKKKEAMNALLHRLPQKEHDKKTPQNQLPTGNIDKVTAAPQETAKPKSRKTKREKAVPKMISIYPSVMRAIEKYAEDNYSNSSKVITDAVRALIPPEYFNIDEPID